MTFYEFASQNPWLVFGLAVVACRFTTEFFKALFKAMS